LPGTICGPQLITGWITTLDQLMNFGTTAVISPAGQLNPSNGRFTPLINGYYKICAFFRYYAAHFSDNCKIIQILTKLCVFCLKTFLILKHGIIFLFEEIQTEEFERIIFLGCNTALLF